MMAFVNSLNEICEFLSITPSNCTCLDKDLALAVREFNFCTTAVPDIEVIYTYNNASLPYAIIALILSFIGLFGNSLVILIAYVHKKEMSTCQKLIGCLAVSDCVFASTQIIITVPLLWTHKWLYGDVLCRVFHTSLSLGSILAIGFIVIISFERYNGIVRPLIILKTTNIVIMVCANIIICLSSLVPFFIYMNFNSTHQVCQLEWPNTNAKYIYESYMLLSTVIIPVALIAYLYVRIIHALKTFVLNNKHLKDSLTKKNYRKKVTNTRKIMKVVLALVFVFLVLVVPNRAIILYIHANTVSRIKYDILSFIAVLTYPCHVTINPIVYSVIDNRWRRHLKTLFYCRSDGLFMKRLTLLSQRSRSTKNSRYNENTIVQLLV